MKTQEIKMVLFAKLEALSTSCQIARNGIAIEKTAEETDEIQLSAIRSLALDSLTRQWEMSNLISQALERLEDGTFGTCMECEDEITEKRLHAIPWAKYCIHCQELRDSSLSDACYAGAVFRPRFADQATEKI